MKKVMNRLVMVFGLAIVGASLSAQDLGPFMDSLMEGYPEDSIQVAFGSFTFEYSELASPYSRWLEDELTKAMGRSSRYRVFNRAVVAAMDPAFRETYADFFATNQVGGLVSGRFFEESGTIRTRFELTDMRTGNLIGSGDWKISKTALPRSVSVRPGSIEQERIKKLATLVPPAQAVDKTLTVSVSTDRGPGGAYRAGEYLNAYITVNRDAYVRLYHVDSAGNTQLIWPNAFKPGDGRIRAGEAVQIPGPGDPFAFLMGPPWGTEYLKAIASSVPFVDEPVSFTDLGKDSASIISRGLTGVKAPKGEALVMAEDLATWLVSEK